MTETLDLIRKWFNRINNKHTISMKDNIELMTKWFDRIEQMAKYKTTLSRKRMTDSDALAEIKVLAKDASEYLRMLSEKNEEHDKSEPVKVSIDAVCDWIKKHHHEYSSWNTTEHEIDFETDKLINDLKTYVSEKL